MQNKNYFFFEDVVEAIKNGYYNEFAQMWHDANDRAIIFYMNKNKADVKDVVEYFGMAEEDVKERIKNIALYCDRLSNNVVNHESFSRREGR